MTIRTAAVLALVAACMGDRAAAETEVADKGTGAIYILGDPVDGAVMLNNKLDGEIDSYLLSPNCSAMHPLMGEGAWQGVEGGWRIMVGGTQTISFDGAPPLDSPACVPQ